jgi:hypothetical protein
VAGRVLRLLGLRKAFPIAATVLQVAARSDDSGY